MMKKMKYLMIVWMAILTCATWVSCSSDDDTHDELTLTLAQSKVDFYSPSGTVEVKLEASRANADIVASQFSVALSEATTEGTNATSLLPTIKVSKVTKETGSKEVILTLDINMNGLLSASGSLMVTYGNVNLQGKLTLNAHRAYLMPQQDVSQSADEITFPLGDAIQVLNIEGLGSTMNDRCTFYISKEEGNMLFWEEADEAPGAIGTQGNQSFRMRLLSDFLLRTQYSLIVKFQRTANRDEGYVWIEYPFTVQP